MKLNRSKTAIISALAAAAMAGSAFPSTAGDPPGLELARQLNDAFVSVADKVSPAVVVVNVTEKPRPSRRGGRRGRSYPDTGEGSGIIVTEDGYILTNNHVVDNADTIEVTLKDGRMFKGEVKGTDPRTDIAVVKINPTGKGPKLTVARLGNSDKLRVGEFVVAIGHPFELDYSVTVGHVSAIERQLPSDSGDTSPDDLEYIQTDAVINPGNSGGPLINLNGEVIGVNAMIEADTIPYTGINISRGIGLAIPINEAKAIKDRLISDGKFTRSQIGISYNGRPTMAALARFDLDEVPLDGVVVASIKTNGPAAKSGLKPDDRIVAVDGVPVKSGRDLKNEVSFKRPGERVTLSVMRGDKQLAIKIATEAEALTVDEPVIALDTEAPEAAYGFSIKALTKELAKKFGVEETSGIIVTSVEPYSPADPQDGGDSTPIRAGDVITKFNNKPISSPQEFSEKLKGLDAGQQWTMEFTHKDSSIFRVFRAPSR